MVLLMATYSMGSILRVYFGIRARLPWLDGQSLDCVDGLSSGRWLSYVSLQRGLAEYDSIECNVEHDMGRPSGPWYGRLGRLSLERESLDEVRRM